MLMSVAIMRNVHGDVGTVNICQYTVAISTANKPSGFLSVHPLA